MEPDGPPCSCGNHSCLQAVASESTMLKNFLQRKGGEKSPGYTFADMLKDAFSGDTAANEEILKGVRYIGVEVGNVINLLSPSLIIINGRVTCLGSTVLNAIESEVRRRCLKYTQSCACIVYSHLGDKAQVKGAAACIIRVMFALPKSFLKA